MTSWAALSRQIVARADERCEYCQMHQSLQGATFHIEHILPTAKGGDSEFSNLALACPRCNLCKSDRTQATDPLTGTDVALFHPRQDQWLDHFGWVEYEVIARTAIGRGTIAAIDLNHERRVLIRKAEAVIGLFPPAAKAD